MPLGACPPRGSGEALGEGRITGGASTCDFCREFPLGEGFGEWERAFTERIPALGEGPESSSVYGPNSLASPLFCLNSKRYFRFEGQVSTVSLSIQNRHISSSMLFFF
jgi:hypothetical protein